PTTTRSRQWTLAQMCLLCRRSRRLPLRTSRRGGLHIECFGARLFLPRSTSAHSLSYFRIGWPLLAGHPLVRGAPSTVPIPMLLQGIDYGLFVSTFEYPTVLCVLLDRQLPL